MPRNNLLLLSALMLVGGCQPKQQLVFVDLNKVPLTIWSKEPSFVFRMKSVDTGGSYTLPALPRRELFLGQHKESIEEAKIEAERSRQKAYEQTVERFREAFRADLDTLRRQKEADLAQQAEKELAESYSKIGDVFFRYADRIGRMQLELASLIGFPDPGTEPAPSTDPAITRRNERLQTLRSEIMRIEDAYRQEKDKIIAGVLASIDARDSALQAALIQLEERRLEEAQRAAARLTRGPNQKAVRTPFISRSQVLPAQESVSVKIESEAANPPVIIPMNGQIDSVARQKVAESLKIWAEVRQYRLSDKRGLGRDATQEFIEWIDQYKVGR